MQKIRELKKQEFNRVLYFVKRIIEIKRQFEQLKNSQKKLSESKKEEIDSLKAEHEELKRLITVLLKYITNDGLFGLSEKEIDVHFVEEYVYILSQNALEGESYISFQNIFESKADFAAVVFEQYGKVKLFTDIVNADAEDGLPRRFKEYCYL